MNDGYEFPVTDSHMNEYFEFPVTASHMNDGYEHPVTASHMNEYFEFPVTALHMNDDNERSVQVSNMDGEYTTIASVMDTQQKGIPSGCTNTKIAIIVFVTMVVLSTCICIAIYFVSSNNISFSDDKVTTDATKHTTPMTTTTIPHTTTTVTPTTTEMSYTTPMTTTTIPHTTTTVTPTTTEMSYSDGSLECLVCKGVTTVDECQEVVKCNRDKSCPVNEGPIVFGPPMEDNIQCTKCCLEGKYCNRQLNCTAPERFSRECSDIKDVNPSATSGVYIIHPDGTPSSAVTAYCDMTDGNAWTVFQRRLNGSVDFYRDWSTYKHGFGTPFGEYWLGNDVLHELTTYSAHQLRVQIGDFDGKSTYALYSTFSVGSESSGYVLTIRGYSGNASDAFSFLQPIDNMKFSTYDIDNDIYTNFSCALTYKGGWWYRDCHTANPNGLYLAGQHESYADGINWFNYTYSLKKITLMIRKST